MKRIEASEEQKQTIGKLIREARYFQQVVEPNKELWTCSYVDEWYTKLNEIAGILEDLDVVEREINQLFYVQDIDGCPKAIMVMILHNLTEVFLSKYKLVGW